MYCRFLQSPYSATPLQTLAKGCTPVQRKCPVGAITGEVKKKTCHRPDQVHQMRQVPQRTCKFGAIEKEIGRRITMNKFRLNINGKEVTGVAGQTILKLQEKTTFLFLLFAMMKELKFTVPAAFACAKWKAILKLCKACATDDRSDGMVVMNKYGKSCRIEKDQPRTAPYQPYGDCCRPPCVLACPARPTVRDMWA